MDIKEKDKERFWSKVTAGRNGCIEWTGARSGGYGSFWVNRERNTMLAHRFAYEDIRGPLPEYVPGGYELDHVVCSNTSCVNPYHVEIVMHRENVLRGTATPAQCARQTHCIRGHKFTKDNLYQYGSKKGIRVCKKCLEAKRNSLSAKKAKSEYDKTWYQANREKKIAQVKARIIQKRIERLSSHA